MIEQLRIKEAIKEHGTSINEVAEKWEFPVLLLALM